jgi:hypothetical protein
VTDDEAIVASVVLLARAVGKDVVAEGVETVGQLNALRALGVDRAQDFLWSPALPANDLEVWLQGHQRRQDEGTPAILPLISLPRPAAAPSIAPESEDKSILRLHMEGASLNTIAAALNADGRRTASGRRWTATTVARIVAALMRPG